MKLSDYAKNRGIHYRTALRRYQAGKIPGAYQNNSGRIIIPSEELQETILITADSSVIDKIRKFCQNKYTISEEKIEWLDVTQRKNL